MGSASLGSGAACSWGTGGGGTCLGGDGFFCTGTGVDLRILAQEVRPG